jgi:hypothetical protein
LEKFFEEAFYPAEARSEARPRFTDAMMARLLAAASRRGAFGRHSSLAVVEQLV